MATQCKYCKLNIKKNDLKILCAICENRYHISSVKVSEENCELVNAKNNIEFLCDQCQNNKKLFKNILEINTKLNTFMTLLEEHNDKIEKNSQQIDDMCNEFKKNVISADNSNTNKLFSDVVKQNNEIVVVKPKNDKQKSEETKKDMKTKINPGKMAVAVNTITNVSRGGIAINCKNHESKKKIKETVEREFSNKYEIIEPKQKNPKIIIIGTEDEVNEQEDDEILNSVVEQNELRAFDENILDKIKIQRKFKSKNKRNYSNIVLDVESNVYKKMINMGKVNIGWRRCNVHEYDNIARCFKCGGFNHFAAECRNEEACNKCAGAHKTENCTSQTDKCINCVRTTEKLKIELDPNHTAYDRNCPCYKRIVEKNREKINYQ